MTNYQKTVAAVLGVVVVLFTATTLAAPEDDEGYAALKDLAQSEAVEVADEDPCRSRCVYRYRRFVDP